VGQPATKKSGESGLVRFWNLASVTVEEGMEALKSPLSGTKIAPNKSSLISYPEPACMWPAGRSRLDVGRWQIEQSRLLQSRIHRAKLENPDAALVWGIVMAVKWTSESRLIVYRKYGLTPSQSHINHFNGMDLLLSR
jgi:hypothetical protein